MTKREPEREKLIDKNSKPSIRKRSYSRAGCDECKRRKMKCDELKPHCFNCTRLGKACNYLSKPKFRFEKIEGPANPEVADKISKAGFHKFDANPKLKSLTTDVVVNPAVLENGIAQNEIDHISNVNMDDWRLLFGEAKLLVHDINDLSVLSDTTTSDNMDNINFANGPYLPEYIDYITPSQLTDNEELSMTNTELIDKIIDHHELKEPHVTYLKTLSTTELSYHLFPFASSIETNEVVKLLLKYLHTCDYLLTSLLAISATFQFNQTGDKAHDLSRQRYTTRCLKLLSQAFDDTGIDNIIKDVIANGIESLLLTVLVLTSNFTATSGDNVMDSWLIHLKGARDLLVNYGQLVNTSPYITNGLALAQTWFFCIEALAGLYAPNGGTLLDANYNDTNDYLKKLFTTIAYFNVQQNPVYHSALSRMSLLTTMNYQLPNQQEFNIYCGFTTRIVALIEEMILALAFVRNNPNVQISPNKVAKVMALINICYTTEIAPGFCRKTFTIPPGTPAHPNYPLLPNKIQLPPSAYGKINNDTYFSWFDLSEQIRTDTIYLRFITTSGLLGLSGTNPLVKLLVLKILESIIFLKSKSSPNYETEKPKILIETANFYITTDNFDNRAIMIQSPFRLCSKYVDNDLDFEKLEIFFLGLIKLGNGSSLSALDSLYKYRSRWKNSTAGNKDEVNDLENSTGTDEVELEIIPFA